MLYDFKDVTSANSYSEAEANGCFVKLPAPNELFVDIDREEDKMQFHLNIGEVISTLGHGMCDGLPAHPAILRTLTS